MSIIEDMDREFIALRPLPEGATWLIGGNVWHAFMGDLVHRYRSNGVEIDPANPPEELFGAKVKRCQRMTGWGLAVALDDDVGEVQKSDHEGVDAQCHQ